MVKSITHLLEKDTWEIKTLEEISERIFSGTGVEDKDKGSGDFPAMKTGDLSALSGMSFYICSTYINSELVDQNKTFSHGDILIIGQSGSRKVVGR